MQVCTSFQRDNHASTPPLSFLQAGCPSCRPTNSVTLRYIDATSKYATFFAVVPVVVKSESGVARAPITADRVLTDVLATAVVRRTLVLIYSNAS